MIRELTLAGVGAGAALALMLSCSDDTPGTADAAVCDCPSLVTVETIIPDAGGGPGIVRATAICPAGYILVGGGCEAYAKAAPFNELRLFTAGGRVVPSDPARIYVCEWDNPLEIRATITAWATCQSP